jgi:gliding motility-associated-like protein
MLKKITPLFLLVFLGFLNITSLKAQNNCACWQPRDTSFHYVPFSYCTSECGVMVPPYYRCDDAGTAAIQLPFHFCLYGISTDTVYINSNGNVTLTPAGANFTTFTSDTFPKASIPPMIAPFWGDVDMVGGTGGSDVTLYKITPHYMIVQWDSVGFYSMKRYLLNSFQCIMSDGSDPIIPNGNNVEFCYRQMQWTTGYASGGDSGFGFPHLPYGSPATVGANKGDGVNFIQFGLFNEAGSNYVGQYPPAPQYDGVAWLNYKSFIFSTCANALPPIVTGVSPCDTFILCMGDTVKLPLSFLSPKIGDSVFSALLPPVLPGVSFIYNHPGNTDYDTLQLIGSGANYGTHTVNMYAYDNQIPHDTSFVSFVLEVDSNATGTVVASKDTICPGDSVVLTANTNPKQYVWSNGATTSSIKVGPDSTTTYYVSISKGKCSLKIPKTIVVLNGGKITITKDTVCPGDSTTLTVHDVITYIWSNGATTSSITVAPDSSTTYKCYCTSGPCGVDTLKKRVTLASKPVVGISGTDSICVGSSTTITATGGGTYSWNTGATTSSINVTPPLGNNTYTVTVKNAQGCTRDTTFKVFVSPLPTGLITVVPSNDTICKGDSAKLKGSGGTSYVWTNNGATTDSIWVKDTVTTTWYLQVSKAGCSVAVNVKITVINPTNLKINLAKDSICIGDSTTMTVTGGGTKFKWLPPLSSTSATVTVKNAGTYSVVVTTYCGTDTLKKTLHTIAKPFVKFTGNTVICKGSSANWKVSGGTSWTWSPPTGLSCTNCANPIASPTVTTTYLVTVSNGTCTNDSSITMTVAPPIVPNITAAPPSCICLGGSCILTASGGGTYLWSTGSNDSVITVSPTHDSTFYVVVDKICKDSAKRSICVDVPSFIACCDTSIQINGSATLHTYGSPSMTYVWAPAAGLSCTTCPNPVASPTVTTTYTVTCSDSMGCSTQRMVTVYLECDDFTVPNVFTPNNDGINDDFEIIIPNYSSYSIQIFDRWGKQVYSSTNPKVYWNGRINQTNDLVSDGTYYYMIDATCGTNTYKKKGFVQVLSSGGK